jgi:hypothetical protein
LKKFNDTIVKLRAERLEFIDAKIKEVKMRMELFPRDENFKTSYFKLLEYRRDKADRQNVDVIYLDELDEYRYRKAQGQL